ncbi:conserved oligomeric Golgi complex subunit 6-like [Scylla paramamosain]|uniref:conserved oligomeric Golgi complex subunit 6-like n=1 Tax=Scylla paramamosain TaxID=85552 RepID=UPI00308297B4
MTPPLHYVGDMLAWVHQPLPSEREAAQSLFAKCSNLDPTEETRSTVASVSESVCRPPRTRIEQTIVTDQRREGGKKPVMFIQLIFSSCFCFLLMFISSLQVTDAGLLVATLDELHQLSYKMFLYQHCRVKIEPPGETLAPTPGVARTLSLLTEVVTAATVADDAHHDCKQIVSCVVDPLMNAISESATGLGAVESAVYLLNCFHQLHTTGDKLEMIQGQNDAQLDTLSQEQINGVCVS